MRVFLGIEKQMIEGMQALEGQSGLPVLIGSHHCPWESQAIHDLNEQGVRIYNRLDEMARVLSLMHDYSSTRHHG